MRVLAGLKVSLDGFASSVNRGAPEPPAGELQRFPGDDLAVGGPAARGPEVGAEIMGGGMFGLDLHPSDPDWIGWWGSSPPFGVPVFVLTHKQRPSLELEGGTTFHFLTATPRRALDLAVAEGGGRDVRISGGPTVVRDFLLAGLVDELQITILPIVLGAGVRLWDDLHGLERDFEVTARPGQDGATQLRFTRRPGTGQSVPQLGWGTPERTW